MAYSEVPDEMPHHRAFNQGLHCLLKQNRNTVCFLKIITCDPSIYIIDHPNYCMSPYEKFIGLKRVNDKVKPV